MMISVGTYLVAITFLLASNAGEPVPAEEIATFVPERPIAGGEIRINYDPGAPGASLDRSDEIYVVLSIQRTDHSDRSLVEMMQQSDSGAFTHVFTLPGDAAFLTARFTTRRANDGEATLGTQVYVDEETPARTAWERSILHPFLQKDYEERFAKERSLYPDNLAVYRTRWFVAGAYDKEIQASMVEKDMQRLQQEESGETVEALYALSYGHLLREREEQGRAMVHRLVELYPDAALTASALLDYQYFAYAQQYQGEGVEQIKALIGKIAARFPAGQLARARAGWFASDEEFPHEVMEAICRSWIDDQAMNPMPYFYLATVYSTQGKSLSEAASLVERALDGMLLGLLRPYHDPSGHMSELYLAAAYRLAARIELERQNLGRALAYAKSAGAFDKITSAASYILEAEIRTRLGDPAAAEAAYVEGWRRGSKEAEDALRASFERRHGDLDGFDNYLDAHRGRPADATNSRDAAPRFNAVSLDGREFDSDALLGKVLVLNFWSIGCVPCRLEMPDLNRLVQKYSPDEVVFLAFATDPEESLRSFLEEREFTYHVIPAAISVFEAMEVDSFPTHMIISKQGEIAARQFGAGPDRAEELGRLIDQALAE
jgi:thiol-disulfide isomerase/thioredoxin